MTWEAVTALAALSSAIIVAPALRLGRLPGDLSFGGSTWRVYLPIGTALSLSIMLSLVLSLAGALMRR